MRKSHSEQRTDRIDANVGVEIFDTFCTRYVTRYGHSARSRLDLILQYRDETIRTEIFLRFDIDVSSFVDDWSRLLCNCVPSFIDESMEQRQIEMPIVPRLPALTIRKPLFIRIPQLINFVPSLIAIPSK